MDVPGPGATCLTIRSSVVTTAGDTGMATKRPHPSDSFHKARVPTARTTWQATSGNGYPIGTIRTTTAPHPPNINPKGPETGDGHVLKGGGWAENLDFTRCANRLGGEPGSLLRGFRCAIDAPAEE